MVGRMEEAVGWFTLLLAVIFGTAVADLAFQTNNPLIIYVWSGLIAPAFWLLITIYLWKTKTLKKDRMKVWAVISSGVLLISFSSVLTSMRNPNMSLLLLIAGFFIVVFAGVAFRVRTEPSQVKAQPTPKGFLKKCVKCGEEIPIASEQCPICGQKQP